MAGGAIWRAGIAGHWWSIVYLFIFDNVQCYYLILIGNDYN